MSIWHCRSRASLRSCSWATACKVIWNRSGFEQLQRGVKMLTMHLVVASLYAASLACGSAKAQATIKIGVSVPSADHGWTGGIDFFAQETKKRLESLHKDLRIIVRTATGPSEQRKSLEEFVATEQINALVILPYESGPLTDSVRKVKEKGIFVTVVDRALSDDKIQDLYVAGNNPGMGRIAAQYLIDKLGGQGNIVVLRGLPTVIDDQRFDAFMGLVKNTKSRYWPRVMRIGNGSTASGLCRIFLRDSQRLMRFGLRTMTLRLVFWMLYERQSEKKKCLSSEAAA